MPSVVSLGQVSKTNGKRTVSPTKLAVPKTLVPQSKEPVLPEWVTRFQIHHIHSESISPRRKQELVDQLQALLSEILDIGLDEVTTVQVRTREGKRIDVLVEESIDAEKQKITRGK
jgi:hypothetical protein